MPSLLDRFRRGAPPGPALPGAGVPADPRAVMAAELAPVFEAAAAASKEADALRAGASDEAERLRAEAQAAVVAFLERGREEAGEARAAEAAACRREAEAPMADVVRRGEQRALAVEAGASAETAAHVEAVTAVLLGLAAGRPR